VKEGPMTRTISEPLGRDEVVELYRRCAPRYDLTSHLGREP
jgi:hypothetical protein